jgi:HEAT repeat protein
MTTGDEPRLSSQPDLTGREPVIGGSTGTGLRTALDGLTSRDWQTRARSAKYLGDQQVSAAADRVVTLFHDHNGQVRDAALLAAVRLGEPAVAPLIALLREAEQPKLIRTLILALSQIGEPALPLLIHTLRTDTEMDERELIQALGAIPHPTSTRALVDLLGHAEGDLHYTLVRALRLHGNRALPALLTALTHSNVQTRRLAARVLEEPAHVSAVPGLIAAAHDSEPEVQSAAIRALGQIGDESAIQALFEMLQSDETTIRVGAANAMGWARDPRGLALMRHMLRTDPAWEVRHAIFDMVLDSGDESSVPELLAIVSDQQQIQSIRLMAVRLLCEFAPTAVMESIAQDATLPEMYREIAREALESHS